MKPIIIIYKIQIVIACFLLVSCSQLGSIIPKSVGLPHGKNVVELKNGAVGIAPKGYCTGPSKYKPNSGNIIYIVCQGNKAGGIVNISFAPMGTDEIEKITPSYLANNQKVIITDYLNGYDLVKVETNQSSVKSLKNTVWRTAKGEKGYMVLAQYFSPSTKNVSDIHQMEVLIASLDNFSPPDNLSNGELSDLTKTIRGQGANYSAKPKLRSSTIIRKLSTSKIRPKLRP